MMRGVATAAKMPIMTMTKINSTNVKPRCCATRLNCPCLTEY